jgi:hypothetical protein
MIQQVETKMNEQQSDRDARVREIAYSLWQDEGQPEGADSRHWFAAEALVDSEGSARKATEGEPPGDVEEPAQAVPPAARKRKGAATVGSV